MDNFEQNNQILIDKNVDSTAIVDGAIALADEIVKNNVENSNQSVEETKKLYAEVVVTPSEESLFGETKQIVYHITDFDGPIPLLYQLIKDAKIAIEDIFVSQITSQYVEIIKNTPKEEMDFEYAGEFITMAAELVYIKSVRTLPQETEDLDEDDPAYKAQLLINKLKEYEILCQQTAKMRELETINRFYRQPTYTDKDYRVALVNFSLPKLVEAFARILANEQIARQSVIPKKVIRDRFSVHDQMEYIRLMIVARKEMKFTDLFEPDYDKNDIVTTFLAMLELLKYGKLKAVQDQVFGDISLYAVEGSEDSISFEEGDNGKY